MWELPELFKPTHHPQTKVLIVPILCLHSLPFVLQHFSQNAKEKEEEKRTLSTSQFTHTLPIISLLSHHRHQSAQVRLSPSFTPKPQRNCQTINLLPTKMAISAGNIIAIVGVCVAVMGVFVACLAVPPSAWSWAKEHLWQQPHTAPEGMSCNPTQIGTKKKGGGEGDDGENNPLTMNPFFR